MDHPIPPSELSPELARVCGPTAPAPMKLMASRGMMPMSSPVDLVTVLYMLAHDDNETLRSGAVSTLDGLPVDVLGAGLSGDIDARVLDFAAERFRTREDVLVAILRNARTADDTVESVAFTAGESVLELIAANETRLLRAPRIIEALYLNRRTRMSTADRAIELAVRNGIVLGGIPAFREIAAAIQGQLVAEADDEPTPDDMLFAATVAFEDDGEAYSDFDDGGGGFGDFDRIDSKETARKRKGEDADDKRGKLGFQISQMTVSQRARLSVVGNAAHRALLLHDPNKLVAMAAIKSPSITDQEVALISQSRSVSEDVIRHIADNREWTKSPIVKRNLVFNPKCPLGQSLRFLPHLRAPELKALVGNKNVPQTLCTAARNILQRRPGQG
ncbi:MAG: hypothetical protein QME96_09275 [Myxococcota bacterium]|nr:hypothetical protein [Myxococcota bacterium]